MKYACNGTVPTALATSLLIIFLTLGTFMLLFIYSHRLVRFSCIYGLCLLEIFLHLPISLDTLYQTHESVIAPHYGTVHITFKNTLRTMVLEYTLLHMITYTFSFITVTRIAAIILRYDARNI